MSASTNRKRVELHVHTEYSLDSRTLLEDLETHLRGQGTDWVAITDHDTIDGALALRDRGNVGVIVGEEVSTMFGDVIGLFLERPIEPAMSPEETIEAIHEQGGLVYIPHPFDRNRKSRLFRVALDQLRDSIDILEIWNGRTAHAKDNERAELYAAENEIVPAVGSDAHRVRELGCAVMHVPEFHDAPSFLDALRTGHPEVPGGASSKIGGFRRRISSLFGSREGD